MRGGQKQHLGTVGRERAAADRAGDDAREVEHLDAGQWPAATRRQRPWRGVAGLVDAEERQPGGGETLAGGVPYVGRGGHGNPQAGLGRGGLERLRLPTVELALHARAVVVAAEQLERAGTMVRQVGVHAHPTAVAAAIEAGNLAAVFRPWLAVDVQIAVAAE